MIIDGLHIEITWPTGEPGAHFDEHGNWQEEDWNYIVDVARVSLLRDADTEIDSTAITTYDPDDPSIDIDYESEEIAYVRLDAARELCKKNGIDPSTIKYGVIDGCYYVINDLESYDIEEVTPWWMLDNCPFAREED